MELHPIVLVSNKIYTATEHFIFNCPFIAGKTACSNNGNELVQ